MNECSEGRRSALKICSAVAGRAAIALGLVLTMLPSPGWAACKISSLDMPVTMVGSRAIATLGIAGTDVPLIVDSGAFYSFLTHAAAQQLKLEVRSLPWGVKILGLTGEMEAGLTTVKKLRLLGGEIPDVDFVVGGNDELNGTMGLLGRNILAIADVEYDLAHGVIRLMVPNDDCSGRSMAYWAADTPVSELELIREDKSIKTPAIQAVAQLNDKKVRVLFDTGARSLVSLRAAKRAGVLDLKPAGKVGGVGRGEADAWTGAVQRFELGGEAISNIRLSVVDFDLNDIDMLLGIDFFLSHRIYVSKAQRRMYFTYNGGPIFALTALENAKAQASASSAADRPDSADPEEPIDAAALARRGAASAARLDFVRALADLDRACAMAPQVAAYFVRRGVVHEAMREPSRALADFDTALQLEPAQAEARLRRAWLRASAGKRGDAIDDLQSLDKTLAPQAPQRLQIAALYNRLGLSERALPQWSLWIASHPYDAALDHVLNDRCWTRTMLNIELEQALDDCDKAIDLQSKAGAYYDSRAWLRLRRGEFRKALADFDRALRLTANSAWSLYGRGIVHRKLGDAAAGQADIEAARKLDPSIDEQAGRHGLAADPKVSLGG